MILSKFVAIAEKEVGVREVGGNNMGPRIREYQAATWLEPGPWPWCAAFTAWVLREWLRDAEVLQTLKDTVAGPTFKPEAWRCRDASAFGWEKWARQKGLKVLPETTKARAGDIIVFDFSHIGIVAEHQTGVILRTIEGNTNGRGERDSESGDGVWRKTRHHTLAKCFIRIL